MAKVRRHYLHITTSTVYPQVCPKPSPHRTLFTCRRKLTLVASKPQKITITHLVTPSKRYTISLRAGVNQLSWCAKNIKISYEQLWRTGKRRFYVDLKGRNILAYYQNLHSTDYLPVFQLALHVENTDPYQEDLSLDDPVIVTTPKRGITLKQLCLVNILNKGPVFTNLKSFTDQPEEAVPRELREVTWINIQLVRVTLQEPNPDGPVQEVNGDQGNPNLPPPLEEQSAEDTN